MTENGQIMLKMQYYYVEISLWESFESVASNSPKILNDYLIKCMNVNIQTEAQEVKNPSRKSSTNIGILSSTRSKKKLAWKCKHSTTRAHYSLGLCRNCYTA